MSSDVTAFDHNDPTADESDWEAMQIAPEAMAEALEAPANVPVAPGSGFAVDVADMPLETDPTAGFGSCGWRTLVCGDRTPSSGMVMGVAEFGPGDTLEPHRHGPAEIYFGLTGTGTVTIEGVAHDIRPGVAVYLPPDAEHGTVAGPDGLTFAYCFPTGRFADVDYRFSPR